MKFLTTDFPNRLDVVPVIKECLLNLFQKANLQDAISDVFVGSKHAYEKMQAKKQGSEANINYPDALVIIMCGNYEGKPVNLQYTVANDAGMRLGIKDASDVNLKTYVYVFQKFKEMCEEIENEI